MHYKNHYEAAFELFLRKNGIRYFSNRQEYRNPLDGEISLKNFDYIVSGNGPVGNWIVDVKGRKFPSEGHHRRFWKHWTTGDDLAGMLHWETFLGQAFRGLFVFAYQLVADRSPLPLDALFSWRKKTYAFIGIDIHDYLAGARLISPRWQTYEMPISRFRACARPFTDFLDAFPNSRARGSR